MFFYFYISSLSIVSIVVFLPSCFCFVSEFALLAFMDKELKRGETIWLLSKPPIVVLNDQQLGFSSSKPPTYRDVYLQFRGYHNYFQIKKNRNSTVREACEKVYLDLVSWWNRTGIKTTDKAYIIRKVLEMHDTWKYLAKYRSKESKLATKKADFKENLEKSFIVVSHKHQQTLDASEDLNDKEDAAYIKAMKNTSN